MKNLPLRSHFTKAQRLLPKLEMLTSASAFYSLQGDFVRLWIHLQLLVMWACVREQMPVLMYLARSYNLIGATVNKSQDFKRFQNPSLSPVWNSAQSASLPISHPNPPPPPASPGPSFFSIKINIPAGQGQAADGSRAFCNQFLLQAADCRTGSG